MGTPVIVRRLHQAISEAAASMNRAAGSGGGSGMQPIASLGLAAGSPGQVIPAGGGNTDITGSSFTIAISRASFFVYLVFASGFMAAAAAGNKCSISGNIVGFDNTAGAPFSGAASSTAFIWYFPVSKGPIGGPAIYTVKMQANAIGAANATVETFFHQVFLLAAS